MQRVLIIRFSSIGDIVLTSPVMRRLKAKHGDEMEVHFLTKAAFASLVEHSPYVDRVWKLGESLDDLMDSLREMAFDHIIDLHANLRSARVCRTLKGVPYTRLDKKNLQKWLLVNFHVDRLPDAHIVDRYIDVARPLGLEEDETGLDFFFPKNNGPSPLATDKPAEGYVAWVVGAAHRGKHFSAEKTARVLDRIDHTVVLIGGPGEREMVDAIQERVDRPLIDMVGKTDLFGSAAILRDAQLVVSPDTGMMHIAAALNKPIISLWGCTSPRFGMYPYHPVEGSEIVQPHGLKRRPCSKLGNRCQYAGWCIERIDEDELVQSINAGFALH